jgi:hypothetical protein
MQGPLSSYEGNEIGLHILPHIHYYHFIWSHFNLLTPIPTICRYLEITSLRGY